MNCLDVLLYFMMIIIQTNELTECYKYFSFSLCMLYYFQINTFTSYFPCKYIKLKPFTKFNQNSLLNLKIFVQKSLNLQHLRKNNRD